MTNKYDNYIGRKYGKLTIEGITKTVDIYADCLCDCGNRKLIRLSSVTSGNTKSCGCIRINNLAGQKFSKLHVDSFAYTKNGMAYWNCTCACGNKTVVRGAELKNGNTKSCGCGMKDHADKLLTDCIEDTRIGALKRSPTANNTSGHVGVYRHKKKQKWYAEIFFKKKRYFLGYFSSFEDAVQAREEAENRFHDDFLKRYAEMHPEKSESMQKKFTDK